MKPKISKALSKHRLEQAKEDLEASKFLYGGKFYKSANNRAYYSIFHTEEQINTAEKLLKLVKEYIDKN